MSRQTDVSSGFFSFPADQFGSAVGQEQFETAPYVSGPEGDGPHGPMGDAAKLFPQSASPSMAGLCGDAGVNIVSSGRVTAAPTDPHPVLPAPNPGGDGLMVKLAQLGRALFGRN